MILPATGKAVHELLDRASRTPARYREIVVSAPFLDDTGRELLDRVRRAAVAADRRLIVALPTGRTTCPFPDPRERCPKVRIEAVPRLHAKVYALLGMDPGDSEAVVTSANLTAPGLFRNREVGLHLRAGDRHLQRVIERVAGLTRN